jgi:hypothetical protein
MRARSTRSRGPAFAGCRSHRRCGESSTSASSGPGGAATSRCSGKPQCAFTPSFVQDSADAAWAELQRVTLHECRHSYSTYLDAAGISETRADRYLGHSNPSVANRYRHQLEGQLADDAARLDAYLIGASTGKVVQLPTGAPAGAAAAQTRLAAQSG